MAHARRRHSAVPLITYHFQAPRRAHCARPGRGGPAFREPLPSGISRCGSFLFSSHEPLFCTILFITFFLIFLTLGKALCPLTDCFRERKGGGCEGKGRRHFISDAGCHPRAAARPSAFSGAPSGPVCAVGMTGIEDDTALSAMLLPPFPTYIMGLLGHREECLPVRQRGEVHLCHPPGARLRWCPGRS